MSEKLDYYLEQFNASMKWSEQATDYEKQLVKCNLNGFVSFLREEGYSNIYEAAIDAAQKYDSPTPLVTMIEKYFPKDKP